MKKLLSIIFAMVIALPALAMDVTITVLDENNEPLIGAAVLVVETKQGVAVGINGTAEKNIKLSNVPNDATIKITNVGYKEKTLPVQQTMNVKMELDNILLNEITSVGCPIGNGIKTVNCEKCKDPDSCTIDRCSGTCVVKECYKPCYKQKGNECEMQRVDGGTFTFTNKQCQLTCLAIMGYVQDPKDQWKCTQDCTSSITDPNVKKARYKGNTDPAKVKCEIVECKGKYHPSDDKQSCIPDQGDCTPEQLKAVHATTGYLITAKNKCVPKECIQPQYAPEGKGDDRICVDQTGKDCTNTVKHATKAIYKIDGTSLVCEVQSCNTADGYQVSTDKRSCTKDCLAQAQKTAPLATKTEFDNTGKCIIKSCGQKDGKKYIPSDDGQNCEETERDCNKQTDSAIWPEHATAASYKKSKTGGAAKCVATECESGYEPQKGQCVSVDDSDCDKNKRPENSTKSHRYYDKSTNETLCLVDECKKGYRVSNDMLSCILESALNEEDAKKRMDELKDNAQAMKERENSTENKLLGAAGIGAVGIGGKNIASALAEESADRKAEDDMKAYLATFRCDYGQGRNILGGETNIQLPGASELIQYTTEYKQLAANLKSDKAALGMLPGIESETIFDSATTGLYDDVGIGTQKGAFTSLSRALMDENSADAKEWQAMKDATAQKKKTGLVVAGAGALGTLAANLAINHGKGDQSGKIWNDYEDLKEPIPDISLERIPCSNFPDTTGVGYVPNCECKTANSYFDEHTRKCEQCGANEHVENKQCMCNDGFHRDNNDNCVANQPNQTCKNLPADSGATGTGDFPNCNCTDQNATFNKQTLKCECKDGYSNPDGGQCKRKCAGLPGVDNSRAANANVPNCPCEYSGATFDTSQNACLCPQGQTPAIENGQKKCITPVTGTPCNTIPGTTGTTVPDGCTCTDTNKEFRTKKGKYGCYCKSGMREDASGNCVSGSDPVFSGNFDADETFDLGAYEISSAKCTQIINKIKTDSKYDANISGSLCISAIGHTDTKYYKKTSGETANRQKNQKLSEDRAQAMYNCIHGNIKTLFPKATVNSSNVIGKNWQECNVQTLNTDTPSCRRVEVKIQLNSCNK